MRRPYFSSIFWSYGQLLTQSTAGSDSNDHFGERKSNKSAAKAAQDQEDYEARKEHSNSGSNTHSGKGMEYVTRKTGSSREDEEGLGKEVVH